MIGAATLVPPNPTQPLLPYESYDDTPVLVLATADTSATVRLAQPESVCHDGFGSTTLQPLPAPDHAVSDQPLALLACVSAVPPAAVTYGDDAGYSTPYPESPELTTSGMPGWL